MVNIHQDIQCSQCQVINNFEESVVNNIFIRKCKNCGHTKVIGEMTVVSTQDIPVIINIEPLPEIEIF